MSSWITLLLLLADDLLKTVGLDVSFPVAVEAPPFVTLTFTFLSFLFALAFTLLLLAFLALVFSFFL